MASGAGRTSQQIIEDLASDILSKIPSNFSLDEVKVQNSFPMPSLWLPKIITQSSSEIFRDFFSTNYPCLMPIGYLNSWEENVM